MFEQQPDILREKVKSLATESMKQADPSGWFETLYAEAKGDATQVPWAKNIPHPYLQDWLDSAPQGQGNALVIGCGLGDDAEALAKQGYTVTAFDISPSAIAWCQQRFPNSGVNYQVADLFNLDTSWQHHFDLVYECRNLQALPIDVRSPIIDTVASLVASEGSLLAITRLRDDNTIPEGPPWALSEQELTRFEESGLQEIRRDAFVEGTESIKHLRLQYRKVSL